MAVDEATAALEALEGPVFEDDKAGIRVTHEQDRSWRERFEQKFGVKIVRLNYYASHSSSRCCDRKCVFIHGVTDAIDGFETPLSVKHKMTACSYCGQWIEHA